MIADWEQRIQKAHPIKSAHEEEAKCPSPNSQMSWSQLVTVQLSYQDSSEMANLAVSLFHSDNLVVLPPIAVSAPRASRKGKAPIPNLGYLMDKLRMRSRSKFKN